MNMDQLPPSITDDEAEQIIFRLYSSTSRPEDRERLINGYMRFAWAIARKISRHNSMYEDLFQIACTELTEIINDVFAFKKVMYNTEIYKVINKNVSHRCKDYVENCRTTRMPGRTIRHYLANGLNETGEIIKEFNNLSVEARLIIQLLPPIYQRDFIDIAQDIDLNDLRRQVKNKLFDLIKIPKFNNEAIDTVQATITDVSLDMKELLDKAICSFREANIIEMRALGMTYQEIGKKLCMSVAQVGVYVCKVEERFDKISKGINWDKRRKIL